SNVDTIPDNSLMIELLTRTSEPTYEVWCLKSILRPELYAGMHWAPHDFIYKNDQERICLDINEMRINHYINRTVDFFYSTKIAQKEKTMNRKLDNDDINWRLGQGNNSQDEELLIFR